ncbi:hypothetical protein PCANB_001116 [Pneumocystis canis]|nr:hypothetical protein PCANB_001116 [Pneumocystis canis]
MYLGIEKMKIRTLNWIQQAIYEKHMKLKMDEEKEFEKEKEFQNYLVELRAKKEILQNMLKKIEKLS